MHYFSWGAYDKILTLGGHQMNREQKITIGAALTILAGGIGFFARQRIVHADRKSLQHEYAQGYGISEFSYRNASASDLAQMIRSGQVTSRQLIKHVVARIKADNPQLNAVISLRESAALQEAADLEDTGQPFYGVPILIKGLGQQLKGVSNTRGLLALKNKQANETSDYVKQLQSLGFIIIGQTNYPELGLINVTDSKLNGTAHNPWRLNRNTGGSSGGAVASVAADFVPLATGNDAGGSLRIPASFTGVIGLKPTQGAITGDSTVPSTVNFANARYISDLQAYFAGMKNAEHPEMIKDAPSDLKQLKIAYSVKSPVGTKVSKDAIKAVKQAVKFLRAQGYTVVKKDAPVDGEKLMKAYYTAATATGKDANEAIKAETGKSMRFKKVSPMTWALYQADKKQTAADDQFVANVMVRVAQQMTNFHEQYPIYLTPTTATAAPKNNDPAYLPKYVKRLKHIKKLDHDDQIQLIYDAWLHGLSKTPFTQLANISGEPALSLPTYVTKHGLPIGIQLQAAKGQDQMLLQLGKEFQDNGQFESFDSYQAKK